jgi:hypothetical protein
LTVDLLKTTPEFHDIFGFLKVHRFVKHSGGKLLPRFGMVANLVTHRLSHFAAEFFVAPRPSGAAQESKFAGKSTLLKQLEEGWNQLAMGEVAACSKNHQALRSDDPLLSQPNPQWVRDRCGHGYSTS